MRLEKGHYIAIAAGMLWGSSALFIRNLLNAGFSPLYAAICRSCLTAIALGVIIFVSDKCKFKVHRKDMIFLVIFGFVGLGVGYIANNYAIKYTTIATAVILSYTNPIYTTVLASVFFKERISAHKIAGLVILLLGCLFLVKAYDMAYLKLNFWGIFFGLVTGVCISIGSLCAKKLSGDYHPLTLLFYTFAFSGVFLLISSVGRDLMAVRYTGTVIVSIVMLIALSTFSAYFLYFYAVRRIEISQAGVCATVEPITASLLGFIFFGERLDAVQLAGAVVMLSGILTYNNAWITFRHQKKALVEKGGN